MYRDYYEILGVRERSTKEEIKARFRELAKQYHPDINKDEGATEKFRLILEAYQVLNDDEKRKEYDELRNQIRKGHIDPAMFREFDEYVASVRKLIDLLMKLERYDIEGYAISLAGLIGGGLSGAWAGFKLGGDEAKQKFERRLNRIESMETKLLVELEKLKRKFSEEFGFSYNVEERSYQCEGAAARFVGRIAGDF